MVGPGGNLAAKKKIDDTAAIAHMHLADAGDKITKHAATMLSHVEALTEANGELTKALADLEKRREDEVRGLQDKYSRDTQTLQGRLANAEEKLRKVQQTLS